MVLKEGISVDRIEILRQRCLERKKKEWRNEDTLLPGAFLKCKEIWITVANFIRKNARKKWQTITKQGALVREVLSNITFEIDELELLVGRIATWNPEREEEFREAQKILEYYPFPSGQTGHAEIDYPLILEHGITGIRKIIQEKMRKLSPYRWEDHRKKEFYQACLLALEGFEKMAENCQKLVRQAISKEKNEKRKEELKTLLKVLERVPLYPATTFYEAIQCILLTSIACQFGERIAFIVPGRLDRTLIKYYRHDLETGNISREKALELIENMYIIINENTKDGGAVSVMVGGQDEKGNDTTNELSYLCLEALRKTRLIYPTVGICWNKNTPEDLLDLACDLIKEGICTPAFFSDDIIIKGMKEYGVPEKEAHNYINSTCVEITPIGSSNVYVASPYFNLCQILLEELQEEKDYKNFQEFLSGYKKRLSVSIKEAVEQQNSFRFSRLHYGGKPLQSIFTKDCIEKGEDIDWGGARYNWVECSFVGLANLVDSLYVIKKEIFEEKILTIKELREILEKNYEGFENIRQRFLSYPKYGNAIEEIDTLAVELTEFLRSECKKYTVYPGSHFIPGFFCWVMHERLGRITGATPDGRKKGFPFADGAGPAQGRERKGPTSAILSTTRWKHHPMLGGIVLNLKFTKNTFKTKEDVIKLKQLIKSYLTLGGFEIQINVVDNRILKEAQKNPEQYSDLMVRVAGYSDYFTRLTSEMQEEIIARAEHEL